MGSTLRALGRPICFVEGNRFLSGQVEQLSKKGGFRTGIMSFWRI